METQEGHPWFRCWLQVLEVGGAKRSNSVQQMAVVRKS